MKLIKNIRRVLKKIYSLILPSSIRGRLIQKIARSSVLTTLYYGFKGTYLDEQKKILVGISSYQKEDHDKNGVPLYKLIRNIHRIEKGLSLEQRREVFADSYILETVEALKKVIDNGQNSDYGEEEISWAYDVLSLYFQVVGDKENILSAQNRFDDLLNKTGYTPGNRTPYFRGAEDMSPVLYDDLKSLAIKRRSIRWFQNRHVPREKIDRAIEVAAYSPSACNRQAFEFRVYDEHDLVKKICELPPGMDGFREGIPCIVVLIGKLKAYFHERDRHLIYLDIGIASMAFAFALETLDLSSVCINWPMLPNQDATIQTILNLEDDEKVVMLMAVGFADPDGNIPFSQKKPLELLRSYNKI
jgi:nitroreductase